MVVVILPPGDKFKILSAYEIVQLAEVIRAGNNVQEGFRNLEEKWKDGDNVYDIDLVSIAVTPLSQMKNRDGKWAKELQELRNRNKKESRKEECKRKKEVKMLKIKTKKEKRQKVNEEENDLKTKVLDLSVNDGNEVVLDVNLCEQDIQDWKECWNNL